MTKIITTITATILALTVAACGAQPVASICNAKPAMDRAIAQADAPGGYKSELLEDSEEYAADEGHCPGLEGDAD